MKVISFQSGNRFKVVNDVEKTEYTFDYIDYKNGIPEIHCFDSNGEATVLEETSLFDLEHV